MLDKEYILNFVPTGMVPRSADSKYVPLTMDRILEDIAKVEAMGVTMVHLHVRDEKEESTLCVKRYGELITEVRKLNPELIVCVSCSGRKTPDLESRLAPLQLTGDAKPDMASLTPTSLNFPRQASITEPATAVELAREMLKRGIVPELEVFDVGMLNVVKYLRNRGFLRDPCYVNFLLGNLTTAQCEPGVLGHLIAGLPEGACWAAGGLGFSQFPANALALASGGGVRVGLEDNLFLDSDRTQLATNHDLVERARRMAAILGRRVMRPATLRKRLGMLPGHGEYGRSPWYE
ncbi:MAG: 3-keto-5-aminohexanoate cleavage protein [Opitutales bacterium]|nr:3-keto-5-aminohexanoate cleavage protein [Opitutales bacterium]